MKRILEDKSMSDEGHKMLYGQRHRGRWDQVSLAGIQNRWAPLLHIPMPDSDKGLDIKALIDAADERRKQALRDIA